MANEKNPLEGEDSVSESSEVVAGAEGQPIDHQKVAVEALELARKEADVAQKEILYLRAEFDNTRKRLLKEQEQAIKFANKNLISETLGILDFLDRALQHSPTLKAKGDQDFNNFISGIEMTQHEFVQMLGRMGVEFLGKVGDKFDPQVHEALTQVEGAPESVDRVVEVIQRGCRLHGRLLKPAKVVVGK